MFRNLRHIPTEQPQPTRPDAAACAFWLFLLTSLPANYTWVCISPSDTNAWWMTPLLTAAIAAVAALPLRLCARHKTVCTIYTGCLLMLFAVPAAVDGFLLLHFSKHFNQDIIDILAETNREEAAGFLSLYLPPQKFFGCLVGLVLAVGVCWRLARLLARHAWINRTGRVMALLGLCLWGCCIYHFCRYRNGLALPQYTTLTRAGYAAYCLRSRIGEIGRLTDNCRTYLEAHTGGHSDNRELTICLVIGESHSVFHTDAYGYDKPTFPLLREIATGDSGALVWFSDAVSVDDHTHTAMRSIFSLNRSEAFASSQLFPAPFKALGYATTLFDNQYLLRQGISFLSNPQLSEMLFDRRNTHGAADEEAVRLTPPRTDCNELIVIHLWGSHYDYAQHYPADRFTRFVPADYPAAWKEKRRVATAHYDNALTYTDFALRTLLDTLKGRKAAVVYLSDHGEEVYEVSDYAGHGNAARRPIPDFQLRIPMFIWLSERYIEAFPETLEAVRDAADRPFLSDDTGHLLLDLAHEACDGLDPRRSVINSAYEPPQRRVLHSIDFDQKKQTSLCVTVPLPPLPAR